MFEDSFANKSKQSVAKLDEDDLMAEARRVSKEAMPDRNKLFLLPDEMEEKKAEIKKAEQAQINYGGSVDEEVHKDLQSKYEGLLSLYGEQEKKTAFQDAKIVALQDELKDALKNVAEKD